jgi:hypothetical protein
MGYQLNGLSPIMGEEIDGMGLKKRKWADIQMDDQMFESNDQSF